jgi:transposase
MSAFERRVDQEIREVGRLEVINGALGRWRWSADAKARIVAESLAPGVVISEVARWHDLRPQQPFAWRPQARQGRLALPGRGAIVRAGGHSRRRCAARLAQGPCN